MAQRLVLGIDIGTTSVSVVAIDAGQLVASTTVAHSANIAGLPQGYAEQSSELLWQAVLQAVRQVVRQVVDAVAAADIVAIGMTGQMHSTLLLDAAGQPCSNVITWQDQRAVVHQGEAGSLLDSLLARIPSDDMHATGCRLAAGYMGTTLFAMWALGQLPPEFASVTFVSDWIAARLCQQAPVTDRSHAASAGVYDLIADDWNSRLLTAAEIDPKWLPEVRSSGAVIGELSASMAEVTGLSAGTQVCNAIGDNQAAVLSALPNEDGVLLINIGTGGQIVWRTPTFQRVAGMDTRYLPSVSGQQNSEFMLVGAGLCGGDAFAWINRTIRQWLQAFGVEQTEDMVWQQLTQQISDVGDDMPPIHCEPFFAGTRPNPQRRAVFTNVGSTNFTPANVARSILQGIAETMFGVYESATCRPKPLTRIVMSGNAARQNSLLVKLVADRFGVPTSVSACHEEAATGAALLAAAAISGA